MVLVTRPITLSFLLLTLSANVWPDDIDTISPQEEALSPAPQPMISVGPQEARVALPSLLETDPLHVFPLLTMVRDGDHDGVSLIDYYSIFTVPKNLSQTQARELIDLAYDADGEYRGSQEFQRRLKEYIFNNGLLEEAAVLVYAKYEPRSDGKGRLSFVSGDSREMCGFDAASSFQMMEESNPVSTFLFESIELTEKWLPRLGLLP